MRSSRSLALLLSVVSFFILSCGKNSSSSPPASSLIDFTKYDTLQFKSAGSSFGVSGSRYDLDLGSSSLKKYAIDSSAGMYVLEKEVTLSASAKASLTTQLQKVVYRKHSQCGNCSINRASVWIEITDIAKPLYYFANQGDCSCPADKENAPTLQYEALKGMYDEILALL